MCYSNVFYPFFTGKTDFTMIIHVQMSTKGVGKTKHGRIPIAIRSEIRKGTKYMIH